MQHPSSLIFLAIVVIWAGYLLQHWIRRREALATARSVDQFSDAMRVLDRHDHRVDSVAERPSDSPHASRPSTARADTSEPRPSLRAGTIMTGETQQPRPEQPTGQAAEAVTTSSIHRVGRVAATSGSPKLRAVALIASFAVLLITIICAPFGALPWWSPVVMFVVTGGVFAWCRASAMAARTSRTTVSATRPTVARAKSAKPAGVKLPRRTAPKPSAAPAPVVPLAKATMPEPVVLPTARSEQVYDVTAAAVGDSRQVKPVVQPHAVAAQAEDGSWQPVAVPPPTYTMKERAPERPEPAPAATSPRSYEHVANEDLPFDGLALDQDLDDLPSVFRAG